MLDPRDRRFAATFGFAGVVALFLATLAESFAGVERWPMVAAAAWLGLAPVSWWIAYREPIYGFDPLEPSDLANAVLFGAVGAASAYAVAQVLPTSIPGGLRFFVLVFVLAPLSTRLYRWIADRVPGADPEYAD